MALLKGSTKCYGKWSGSWIQKNARNGWRTLGSVLIAYNATRSLVMGYSPYYLMFGQRPRLPIDLLFPTHREHNLTHTIDEYVETLYKHLRKSVKIAQDSALKEALWQKRLYDRKVGAVELQSGDCVLVKLDAFRDQWWKLKNWWGSDLHTVQSCVADGVPTYVVRNVWTRKMKVLHHSRLLLWLANFGEPVQMNHMCTSITLWKILAELQGSEEGGPVPGCVQCGLNFGQITDHYRHSGTNDLPSGARSAYGCTSKWDWPMDWVTDRGRARPEMPGLLCSRRPV